MKKELNFKQELTCLLGTPVAENPTQAMIEAAFAHHNLDWRYLTIEVESKDLEDAIRGMRAMKFRGGNCTIPHKVAVIPFLDRLGESASLMGAVNCIVREGSELVGQNTDGKGFLSVLERITNPGNKKVVIIGAGGAARAISVELALAGVKNITIVNRTMERGKNLIDLLNSKTSSKADFQLLDGEYTIPEDTDIVINATSIGLYPNIHDIVPINFDSLTKEMIVADVIPNPPGTELIKAAKTKGCQVVNGLEMLVGQGVIGFEYWTGIKADENIMQKTLENIFSL